MRDDHYPEGYVQDLLQTPFVNEQTRQLMQERLSVPEVIVPVFFEQEAFITLHAVAGRLLPQPATRRSPIDLAGAFDKKMAGNESNGWRYNDMPPDSEAFPAGLKAIDNMSNTNFGKKFHLLEPACQDRILSDIQAGQCSGEYWNAVVPKRFFEELLTALTEIYYSHPLGREEIGDVSWADVPGWPRPGLNQLEAREPLPVLKHGANE